MTKKTKTTRSSRVEARPDPRSWDMDELLTLQEAVDLHWPEGPITLATIRWCIRQKRIQVCEVAGKHFLTRRILLDLSKGQFLPSAEEPDAATTAPSADAGRRGVRMTEAEARALVGLPPR